MTTYNIAVVHGDGIGPEVCSSAVEVLRALPIVGSVLRFIEFPGGANEYLRSGSALPKATLDGCRGAHAILHGATGIPGVTYADGTETGIEFGLQLRFSLDLYANVRPIRLRPGVRSRLAERAPGSIDYVIVRENTEGLYAARGAGIVLRDETAVDSLVITRKGTERICRFAFELARGRNGAPGDGKKRVTCCDKANVLRSYAFFRRVFDDVAREYPDIEADYAYADAMTCYMIERPEHFDVIVTENMFGDIITDLGGAVAGGVGRAASANLNPARTGPSLFEPVHGSAPDIAGTGTADPRAAIISAAMLLEFLGETEAAARVQKAVAASDDVTGSTTEVGDAIAARL